MLTTSLDGSGFGIQQYLSAIVSHLKLKKPKLGKKAKSEWSKIKYRSGLLSWAKKFERECSRSFLIKYRLVEHNCPGVGARAVPVAPGNVIESLENLDLNAGCTRLPFRKISEGFEGSNKLSYVLFLGATNPMSIDQFAGTNERFEQLIHFRENDRPFSCECKNETHYTNKGNMFVQNFKANVDENSRWNMNLLVLGR